MSTNWLLIGYGAFALLRYATGWPFPVTAQDYAGFAVFSISLGFISDIRLRSERARMQTALKEIRELVRVSR